MSVYSAAPSPSAGQRAVPVPQQVGRAVARAFIPQADPAQVLLDLRLPDSLFHELEPVLAAQGYAIAEHRQADPYTFTERRLTIVANDGVRRSLVHVPKWILDDPQPSNVAAVTSLSFAFKPGTFLFVFSEGSDAAARAFRKLMLEAWKQLGITVEIVPWRDVLAFRQLNESQRASFVRDLLRLPDSGPSPMGHVQDLTRDQKERLCKILGHLFEYPRLRELLDFKLSRNLDNITRADSYRTIVYEVVTASEREGWTTSLVSAARQARPKDDELSAFARELGLPPPDPDST